MLRSKCAVTLKYVDCRFRQLLLRKLLGFMLSRNVKHTSKRKTLVGKFSAIHVLLTMAFSNIFGAKKHLLKVKSFTINQAEVLGTGAFGVVFRGIQLLQNE